MPERSRVWVEARSSVHPIHGEAAGLLGEIEAEVAGGRVRLPSPPAMRLELPVERLSSGNRLYDLEMQRRVQARRYPRIVGEARAAEELDAGRYRVRGELTFHGVTRQVEGEVRLRANGEQAIELEGERVFDVRDFGVEPPRIAMLRVHPQVTVRVRLLAERER